MSTPDPMSSARAAAPAVQPDRRRPKQLITLVAGVIVGSLATLLVVTTTQSSVDPALNDTSMPKTVSPSKATASGSPAVISSQDELVAILEQHIPTPVKSTCRPGDGYDIEQFSIASVVCTTADSGAAITVQYSWLHDGKAQKALFLRDLSKWLPAGKNKPHLAACAGAVVYGPWWMEEAHHPNGDAPHTVGTEPPSGASRGGALCYWTAANAVIEWYDTDTRIYGWASTRKTLSAQLFNWWQTTAGPWHPSDAMNGSSGMGEPSSPSESPGASASAHP